MVATASVPPAARWYDSNTGRFTQEDPIGLVGGLNLYGFANGDPVNFADPFGLQADTTQHDKCEVAGILRDYVEALSEDPGRFAEGFRTGYPAEFDFKYRTPDDLYQVGDQWLRADQFGNFAAGYAGHWVLGFAGYAAMRAGGIRYAREGGSGEHPSDLESAPMINAGAARAWLDHPSLPVAGMHGSGMKPPQPPGGPLMHPTGCERN